MDYSFDVQATTEMVLEWLRTTGVRLLIIIIITFIALLVARLLINRLIALLKHGRESEASEKRLDTLSSVFRHIIRSSILAVAILMALDQLGIEIGPILAAAGVVGLAIGFGAQNLVHDVISGLFILLEDQIRVGDVVQIAGQGGIVERVNLRMVVLRDLSGNVHFVRNGKIDLVTNMTKDYSFYLFDIGVAYRENTDDVISVAKEVDKSMQDDPGFASDILAPLEILGVDKFADSAVVIKARIKTKPIKQWRVGREFNRRLKLAFDERGIEIPFPHMTVYMGQDKTGDAPPLRVLQSGPGSDA